MIANLPPTTLIPEKISRRRFLQGSAGLVVALSLPFGNRSFAQSSAPISPNAYVHLKPDNTITVLVKHIEIGQGAFTGLATLVADEMDADWSQMRAEHAPANMELYKNFAFGIQGVGGSTGLANSYMQMRNAGASIKANIVQAAANKWNASTSDITVAKGVVTHKPSGNSLTFGELADAAAKITPPQNPTLKTPDQFIYIGKSTPKLDTPSKINGTAVFTQDISLPNMRYAVVAHKTHFGATLASFDASAAEKVNGVLGVYQIPTGVAVVAESTFAAIKGREALKVNWDTSKAETRSTKTITEEYIQTTLKPGKSAGSQGNVKQAMASAQATQEKVYTFPFLAHAPMETLDGVVRANSDGTVDVWMGSQLQTVDQGTVAGVMGVGPEKVNIMTQIGGGTFGRRAQPDSGFAAEAAFVAKTQPKDIPVKLMWTREDDIQGGRYRPLTVHRVKSAIDSQGNITAWDHTIATQSIIAGTPFQMMMQNGIDPTSVEGANDSPYKIANRNYTLHDMENPVPILWWRSVGHTHTAFVMETMLDYTLEQAETDPISGRRALLSDSPRDAGVLDAVAKMADAAGPVPAGHARGIAVHKSFGTYVAEIAEVTKNSQGLPKVTKVWCAVDCGLAVNPDIVIAQVEGGIGFGLSAILDEAVDLADGGTVVQSNFDSYRPLRINAMPDIEVYIVPSDKDPSGIGEPATPPIGPAVANAWRRLTGQMITDLPMNKSISELQQS